MAGAAVPARCATVARPAVTSRCAAMAGPAVPARCATVARPAVARPAVTAHCAAMAGAAVAGPAVAGAAVAARCAAVTGPAVTALLRRPRLHSRIRLSPLPSHTLRSHPSARCFQVSAAKKAKEAGDKTNQALSVEQQERIRKNKEATRQLLAERNVPPGFGDSWWRQLAGEFSKPYFVELMAFVAEERKRYTVYPPPEQVFIWTQMCDIWDFKAIGPYPDSGHK